MAWQHHRSPIYPMSRRLRLMDETPLYPICASMSAKLCLGLTSLSIVIPPDTHVMFSKKLLSSRFRTPRYYSATAGGLAGPDLGRNPASLPGEALDNCTQVICANIIVAIATALSPGSSERLMAMICCVGEGGMCKSTGNDTKIIRKVLTDYRLNSHISASPPDSRPRLGIQCPR